MSQRKRYSREYKVENSVVPTKSSLSESNRSEMEVFLENIKVLVSTLGHKFSDSKREGRNEVLSQIFTIKSQNGADAQGEPVPDGFLVLKGSKATIIEMRSLALSLKARRAQLLATQILKQVRGTLKFTEDYIFTSASTAAAIILGRSSNGLTEWKLPWGPTLKAFEVNQAINTEFFKDLMIKGKRS